MELLVALFIVFFFAFLNEIRVGLMGKEDQTSELFISISTLVAGFLFGMVLSA